MMLDGKALGARGEELAARHLVGQGYRLLARNHRTRLGELDIVAEDGPEVVFVEVKTRVGGPNQQPEESVGAAKVSRLARLAEAYLLATDRQERMWRIDVVAVVLDRGGSLRRLDHLRNAVY
jgi:putative endonuclease